MEMAQWFLQAGWVFGVGLALGSFCNVLIYRLPERKSITRPGSACPTCAAPIAWRDKIPLISYFLLRGRCRHCSTPISARYPLVELLCGMLCLGAYARLGWGLELAFRGIPLVVLCLAITFIDLDHRIIPDRLSLTGLLWGVGTSFFSTYVSWYGAMLGALFGFCFFYFFAWLYARLTHREGLGGGDIKYLAMSGAFTGPYGVLLTVTVSSVVGSIIGIGLALVSRRSDRKKAGAEIDASAGHEASEGERLQEVERLGRFAIPFGPFLVLGTLYSYFFGS